MDDALALLRDRLAKAETKAARAEKAWEAAKADVADLQTALRVMSEITGETPSTGTASANVAERQLMIVRLLGVGEEAGTSPAQIFEMFKMLGSEELSIDTFRTTIWRMKDNAFADGPDLWLVKGDDGQYWKEPSTFGTRVRYEERARAAASLRVGPTPRGTPVTRAEQLAAALRVNETPTADEAAGA